MKRLIASLALAACAFSAWALPSVEQVQAEVRSGNYARAEAMMLEVVTAKPGSARAHYLYAELLAHDKRFAQASEEAAQARRIDPALSFTDPEKFRSFEQLLAREQGAVRRGVAPTADRSIVAAPAAQAPLERSGSLPSWVWVLGIGAVALVIWRMVRPRAAPAAGPSMVPPYGNAYGQPAPYGAGAAPGYAPGQGPIGGPMGGAGSGMLGTGLAVAGGLAAGVLAEKFIEGRRDNGFGATSAGRSDLSSPGFFGGAPIDDGAARELEQRDVDFGSGTDDWGGDDGGSSSGGGDGW